MILHVTFTDGSNPWVSLPADRQTIAKHWRKWENCPEAIPEFFNGVWCCRYSFCGQWRVFKALAHCSGEEYLKQAQTSKYYKHLGHALAALERLGGVTH